MTASTAPPWSFVDVESFIHEYYDAWGGTDEDRIMSYYAEDVVLQIPGVLLEGEEAVRDQFVRPFITAFPGNRHIVKNVIHGSGAVVVEFSFEAQHKGPFGGHAATGARINLPGSGVYEYDSAKRLITAGRIYFDVGTLLQTITELPASDPQKAAEALHLNERNLSLIINTIPTFAWSARPDGYRDFLNQRWLDYTGITKEQAAGWGWAEAIHPDDRQRLVEYWRSCLASGVPAETEARLRRFDGSYRWFLFRANPLRDESGRIVRWYGTNIDIEDRKRGEDALRASELSWRQIVDNIPGLVATTGAMGEVEFLNRQTLEYFGRTSEELKDWALVDAVHPDDLPRVIEARKKSIEEGSVYDIEHRCRRSDGVYRWFQVRGIPVRNAEGTITVWYLLLTDIDDRKKAEEALQSSERNLSLTINTIPTFISVSRADGTVLSVNKAALDYHGVTLQDVQKGDHRTFFFHPDDVERVREVRNEALKHPRPFEYELRAMGKDGKYRWFSVRHNPLLDDQGRIERWYAIAFDIENQKRAEAALRSAERNLNQIINTIPTHIYVLNTEGSVQYVNQPVMDYTGLSLEDVKQEDYRDRVIHPEDLKRVRAGRAASLERGAPFSTEQRVLGNDGRYRWFLVRYNPLLDEQGRIARWYVTAFDIEDRKQAEAEIERSEAKHRQVIDAIPALAWCNLPDGPNEFLSKPWHEYTGLSPEESQGWGWQAAFHPEDLKLLMERWVKMLASGEPDDIEARLRRHDGAYRWFLIRAEPFRDESGNIVRWYGTSTDIDDRKRAEEALQSSERNLRQVIDTIPTLIHVLSPDGSVLYVNPRVLDYTGLTLEDIQRGDYRARVGHPEDGEESLRERRAQALSSAVPFESEYRVLGKDGQYRWFLAGYNPLLDERGRIERWYVASVDIEDRKRVEDAQARQAGVRADVSAAFSKPTQLREILRGCAEAIVHHLDAAFARIWMLNKDESMLELQASAGMYTRLDGSYSRIPIGDLKVGLIGREKKAHLTNDVMNDPSVNDKGWARSNGMVAFAGYPLVVEDRLIGVVALFARHALPESILDTLASVADTLAQGIERKRAEEALTSARSELAHMARVTTLSALTASIAHEINQPIAAVTTSAGACLRWLNRDQPEVRRAREAAMRIEEDGRRAAEIIAHLKSFYKKDVSPQREMVSVNELVGEMLVLLRSEADHHSVVIHTELAADLLPVSGDRVQLQQVLMNLMLNGMEAMSERGGELKVCTRRERGEVMVSVSDAGEGIPADKMEEIFNAFFTTKSGGTGMGLAISSTIIESHGGRLWATANPGGGSTFHFTLPTEPKE